MATFTLIVFGCLALLLVGVLALGAWNPRSIAELTGRADERRLAGQAMIEERDIGEMVDAHNDSRRKRGKPEVSEGEIRARADAEQRRSIARAKD
jgi:hypothetical protein